jgi:uncharacterized secreted protein with C-terminal beta-propeller domain
MSKRFNPFTGKQTAFKFTDVQIACMQEEDSLQNDEITKPKDGDKVYEVHDTLMRDCHVDHNSKDTGLYFAFGQSFKCYPADGNEKFADIIAELAKGDK